MTAGKEPRVAALRVAGIVVQCVLAVLVLAFLRILADAIGDPFAGADGAPVDRDTAQDVVLGLVAVWCVGGPVLFAVATRRARSVRAVVLPLLTLGAVPVVLLLVVAHVVLVSAGG